MSKVVTLRIDEAKYKLLKALALQDNRPLSNYIETATLRYIEEHQLTDDLETDQTKADTQLQKSLEKGVADYKTGKGSFV